LASHNVSPFLAERRRVSPILSHVGDKWSLLVVMLLADGPRRFNDIKNNVEGISQRMLTLTLRGLERDGMVTRTMFSTIPPRVDYELTLLGHTAKQPIRVLVDWTLDHLPEIEAAQAKFDLRKKSD
jgi:DNA-binding HxlR family transcriptional regulator